MSVLISDVGVERYGRARVETWQPPWTHGERVWKTWQPSGVPWIAQFGYGTGGRHDAGNG